MTNFEQKTGEKLGMRDKVQAIYLEGLKQYGIEEVKSVHCWRGDSGPIRLWTTLEHNPNPNVEPLVDAEIAVRRQFPFRSFRFHILIEGLPPYERLREEIPEDATLIYSQTQPGEDGISA